MPFAVPNTTISITETINYTSFAVEQVEPSILLSQEKTRKIRWYNQS